MSDRNRQIETLRDVSKGLRRASLDTLRDILGIRAKDHIVRRFGEDTADVLDAAADALETGL